MHQKTIHAKGNRHSIKCCRPPSPEVWSRLLGEFQTALLRQDLVDGHQLRILRGKDKKCQDPCLVSPHISSSFFRLLNIYLFHLHFRICLDRFFTRPRDHLPAGICLSYLPTLKASTAPWGCYRYFCQSIEQYRYRKCTVHCCGTRTICPRLDLRPRALAHRHPVTYLYFLLPFFSRSTIATPPTHLHPIERLVDASLHMTSLA